MPENIDCKLIRRLDQACVYSHEAAGQNDVQHADRNREREGFLWEGAQARTDTNMVHSEHLSQSYVFIFLRESISVSGFNMDAVLFMRCFMELLSLELS